MTPGNHQKIIIHLNVDIQKLVKITTQIQSQILVIDLYMFCVIRPSFEVVKDGRNLKKIKNMQIKIASVFVMCNPLQDLFKI
jgi:hypothetical protein